MYARFLPSLRNRALCLGLALSLVVAMVTVAASPSATATTIAQKSLSDLVKASEFIFEGLAVSRAVEAIAGGQAAQTCLKFRIIETIAGHSPGGTVRLCFFGGELNGQGFGVSGMRYPTVGERGIYLVESAREPLLNPLIGWDQGRYLVEKDSRTGVLKMMTADRRRITGISPQAARPTEDGAMISPSGASAGGVTSDSQPDLGGAMTRDTFVSKLRSYRGQ